MHGERLELHSKRESPIPFSIRLPQCQYIPPKTHNLIVNPCNGARDKLPHAISWSALHYQILVICSISSVFAKLADSEDIKELACIDNGQISGLDSVTRTDSREDNG